MTSTDGKHTLSLGLDLDGVVGDYIAEFRRFVARAKNVPEHTLGDQTHWSFVASGWVDSEQEFLELHAAAVRDGMFKSMPAIAGASEALWKLSNEGVHIRVVTHRLCVNGTHASAAGDTVSFLEAENIPYRDLCFVSDKALVHADVNVDDAPHNIERLRAEGRLAVVFDQPYNRHLPGPRVYDWGDAYEKISRFARNHDPETLNAP